MNVKKALQLGVPKGPLLGKLQKGQDVTLENGSVVRDWNLPTNWQLIGYANELTSDRYSWSGNLQYCSTVLGALPALNAMLSNTWVWFYSTDPL